jgi:hypothetical protein
MQFETLGQYHDAWATIILFAPGSFTTFDGDPVPDQAAALAEAFGQVRGGFALVRKKIKDERLLAVLQELVDMSQEAYSAGDTKRGAHVLQECEGLIWPSRRGQLKYAVEAEQRRFGELHLFKDVRVSPYPCEGAAADLGPCQAKLFECAREHSRPFVEANEPFKALAWVMHADGSIHQVRAPSQKKLLAYFQQAAASGNAVAYASAYFPFGSFKGLLSIVVEEANRPRAEIISLVEDGVVEAPRFHLHESQVFTQPAADA